MSTKVIRSLLARIEDGDDRVATKAAAVLADEAAVKGLIELVTSDTNEPALVAELLWQHRCRPPLATWQEIFEACDEEAQPAVLRAIASLDVAAAESDILRRLADRDDEAVELAGDVGVRAAIPLLMEKVDEMLGTLRDVGGRLRLGPDAFSMELLQLPRAIIALGRLGQTAHLARLPALARLPSTDDEFTGPIRAMAARGLCEFAVAGMLPTLRDALKKEKETEVAVALIDALTMIGTPSVIAFLLKLAKAEQEAGSDRLLERLNDLIGGELEDDAAALAQRWAKIQPQPAPELGYRGGAPVEIATLAPSLAGLERAPTLIADAVAMTSDRFGCLQPELAARFMDLGPRVRAWASSHSVLPGTVLKRGQAVDVASLG